MTMTEKIKLHGLVKAISNPFSDHPMESRIIMIETDRGMISLPVEDPRVYSFNEKVDVSIILKKDSQERGDV